MDPCPTGDTDFLGRFLKVHHRLMIDVSSALFFQLLPIDAVFLLIPSKVYFHTYIIPIFDCPSIRVPQNSCRRPV